MGIMMQLWRVCLIMGIIGVLSGAFYFDLP